MLTASLIGTVLGFLSGLGTGGGSLLILWLTLVLDHPEDQARIINLMFFVPCALIACIFRWKQGTLRLKKVLPGLLAGCACALAFSLARQHLDGDWIKKAFGVLLIYTGLWELFYRRKKER